MTVTLVQTGATVRVVRGSTTIRVVKGGTVATFGAEHPTVVWDQTTPAATWFITHNLTAYPSVTTVDGSGDAIEGDVQYLDNNNLIITFSVGVTGTAYLN